MRLKDKRAIVTGAAQGLGRAIAQQFVAEGARVLMADIDGPGVAAAAKAIGAEAMQTDVALKTEIDALAAHAIQTFGGIDIVVNNAGITHAADFFDLTEADWDRVMNVNLKAAFLLSQAAARDMKTRRSGIIINISSINAVLANPESDSLRGLQRRREPVDKSHGPGPGAPRHPRECHRTGHHPHRDGDKSVERSRDRPTRPFAHTHRTLRRTGRNSVRRGVLGERGVVLYRRANHLP